LKVILAVAQITLLFKTDLLWFFWVADWRDEFVRGGYAATHKFILGQCRFFQVCEVMGLRSAASQTLKGV
jgi:hypothetical protein